jgi:hypothetical protein
MMMGVFEMEGLTTAQCRKLAREAEANLDWHKAVIYWKQALKVYPNTKGELAEADKDKIITAINSDLVMMTYD